MKKDKIIGTVTQKNIANKPAELALLVPCISDKVCSDFKLQTFFTIDARLNTLNAKSLIDVLNRVNYLAENTTDSRAKSELLVISSKLFAVIGKTLDLSEIHNYCASRKDEEQL